VQCEPLKHRIFNLTQPAFWADQEAGNECAVLGDNLKHRFLDLNHLSFMTGQRPKYLLEVQSQHLKDRFIDFIQVGFWWGQEAENFCFYVQEFFELNYIRIFR